MGACILKGALICHPRRVAVSNGYIVMENLHINVNVNANVSRIIKVFAFCSMVNNIKIGNQVFEYRLFK